MARVGCLGRGTPTVVTSPPGVVAAVVAVMLRAGVGCPGRGTPTVVTSPPGVVAAVVAVMLREHFWSRLVSGPLGVTI